MARNVLPIEGRLKLVSRSALASHTSEMALWEHDCEWEGRARKQLLAGGGSPTDQRDHARQWWHAVQVMLRDYLEYDTAECPLHLPRELVKVLREDAGHFAAGQLPENVSAVLGRGAPRMGPRESEQIAIAQAYVRAVRDDRTIVDKSPVKSIADAYSVARGTARRWVNKVKLGYQVAPPRDPQELIQVMLQAGAEYASTGRSKAAIWARARPAPK